MSDKKRSFARIALIVLVLILVVLVGMLVYTFVFIRPDYPGSPPTRAPTKNIVSDEVTADPTEVVVLKQTREAYLQAREPTLQAAWSTLVEATGFVTVTMPTDDLAFDGKRLWIASAGKGVWAIDLVSHEEVVSPIKFHMPRYLTFGGQHIWVVEYEYNTMNRMYLINVNTGTVGSPVQVGGEVFDVVYDGTRLWVALIRDGSVQAIDPATGRVSQPIRVGGQPFSLAVDRAHRRLWVGYTNKKVIQAIDLDKGVLVDEPIAVGFCQPLAYDSTRLWLDCLGAFKAIDPVTLEADPLIPYEGRYPCDLAIDGRRLWFVHCMGNNPGIQALDTSTGKLSDPIPVRDATRAIEFDGTRLWVGTVDNLQYFIPRK